MLFGEQTDEAEALMLTDRALDAGLHFVGPANIYSRGRSEEIIRPGAAAQQARVVLATIAWATAIAARFIPRVRSGDETTRTVGALL